MKKYGAARANRREVIRAKLSAYATAISRYEVQDQIEGFRQCWYRPDQVQPLIHAAWHSVVRASSDPNFDWAGETELTDHLKQFPGAHFFFGLGQESEKHEKIRHSLKERGLPEITCLSELCDLLRIPAMRLAWLTNPPQNKRRIKRKSRHYSYTWIPKRNGGSRLLEIPKPELMELQRRVDRLILIKMPTHIAAHGFSGGTDTRSNAKVHIGSSYVCKMDIENFFPSIIDKRIEIYFESLGYPKRVASMIALICTHKTDAQLLSERQGDARVNYQYVYGERHLPQGAPTSPRCANAIAYRLDARLEGLAKSFEMNYSRYADDLTFSSRKLNSAVFRRLIPIVAEVVNECGFKINHNKTRVLGRHRSQRICGIVTNEKLNPPGEQVDTARAMMHRHRLTAIDSAGNLPSVINGNLSYLTSINPDLRDRIVKHAALRIPAREAFDRDRISVTVDGVTFRQIGKSDYLRKDGRKTTVLEWSAECAVCKKSFVFKSPRGYNAQKFSKRCEAHRR